jgi:hypothetical protein
MTTWPHSWRQMRRWLCCLVVGHSWVSWLDAGRREDRVWGFTKRVCTDCKLVEYAPGACAGDPPQSGHPDITVINGRTETT